jgi:hypothetical protein
MTGIVVVGDRAGGMRPAIAGNGGGKFAIMWQRSTGTQLLGRLLDTEGQVVGEPFVVAEAVGNNQPVHPRLAMLVGGRGFAACWLQESDINICRFQPNGLRIGEPLRINAAPVRSSVAPSLVRLAGGGLMAVWMAADNREGLRARLLSADARPESGDFSVSGAGLVKGGPIAAAALEGSGVAMAWREGQDDVDADRRLNIAVVDLDGTPIVRAFVPDLTDFNGEVALSPMLPTGADERPGQFALITGAGSDDENRVLVASLLVAGVDNVIAPGNVTHPADEARAERPSAAMLPAGGFVVAWSEVKAAHLDDVTKRNVKARIFGPDGVAVQTAIDVSAGLGDQNSPAVAVILSENGERRTGVAWVDLQAEASAATICARILEAGASPV